MWLDVSKITHDSYRLAAYLRKETGLIVSAGSIYRGNGNEFLRINLASPKSMIEDGISRLITGIKKIFKKIVESDFEIISKRYILLLR